MTIDFKFPDVGEGITEGEIVKWRVKVGDKVKADQVLVEVETDKAVVEIPSPQAGTILKIYNKEGDIIKVGETLVSIGEKGERVSEVKKKSVSVVGELEESPEEIEEKHVEVPFKKQILAIPKVRKLAKDLGVDLHKIKGTGPKGRITEQDVKSVGKKVKK